MSQENQKKCSIKSIKLRSSKMLNSWKSPFKFNTQSFMVLDKNKKKNHNQKIYLRFWSSPALSVCRKVLLGQ